MSHIFCWTPVVLATPDAPSGRRAWSTNYLVASAERSSAASRRNNNFSLDNFRRYGAGPGQLQK